MIRIAGTNIPEQKRIIIALTYIKGVGKSLSGRILKKAGIDPDTKTKDLKENEVNRLRQEVEGGNYKIEGDLRREIKTNIKRLKEIGTYRGQRHARGLPVRGQQTQTNSRTVRGNVRRTMGSGRRSIDKT
ncbi:MAG: 30S ribosomal protein S13 [Candidatus Portnoybacteria bacterium]|nr:30S ribosomal protein S13 [Candidatus Portnoybacteria bacterium]